MKWLIPILILAIVLIAGCTQWAPAIYVCPDGTIVKHYEWVKDASVCPKIICKGTARCFNGTVTRIVDGDTLDVNNTTHIVRIRLTLVDAPEPDQTGGPEAKSFVEKFCPINSEALVDEDDGQTKGSFDRIIAVVYCNDKNLNLELILDGHAIIDEEFCNVSEFANENWGKNYGC